MRRNPQGSQEWAASEMEGNQGSGGPGQMEEVHREIDWKNCLRWFLLLRGLYSVMRAVFVERQGVKAQLE